MQIVDNKVDRYLILILNCSCDHSVVEFSKQTSTEPHISCKILVSLEDRDDIVLSQTVDALLHRFNKLLNNGHVLNEVVGGLGEDLQETGMLGRGQ